MLETGSPPQDESTEPRSVSPQSSHSISRSSSPGLSFFDGTPLYLFPFSIPPQQSPQDMAIKPYRHQDNGHQDKSVKAKHVRPTNETVREKSNGPTSRSDPGQAAQHDLAKALPSLSGLAYLLRAEKYESRKCRQIQHQLYTVCIIAARHARLLSTARSIQRTLAECIKAEDKNSFVNLFNAFHDAFSDCSERTFELDEDSRMPDERIHSYPRSFLDTLPSGAQETILGFLTKVKQDSAFVADRLSALNHRELVALLPEKGLSKSDESIFGSSPRTSSRTSKHLGFVVDGQTELLSSFDLASPLELLIQSVRGMSGNFLAEDFAATDVWATACARLISEQRPGSEKFVPAVINFWASSSTWPGKHRLELWISQTLQDGSFLLEQPSRQSFKLRVQGRQEPSPEEEVRLEAFYANAVDSLLQLLADPSGPNVIPPGARTFCQTICRKLQGSPRHQRAFPNFVITRWLLPSFLADAITLPEMHGLLTDHFISDNARHRILREVLSRSQKTIFDVVYSWKLGNVVTERATQMVQHLADQFQGVTEEFPSPSLRSEDLNFVAVSATDVLGLVKALYPQRRPSSLSDRDPSQQGLQSSASSVSGLSLFQNIGTHDSLPNTSSNSIADGLGTSDSLYSDRGPAFGSSSVNWLADMDGEQLRDACLGVEDFSTSRHPSGSDQWSVLVDDPSMQSLCTVRTRILNSSKSVHGLTAASQLPSSHGICRNTIKELLLDSNIKHDSGSVLQPKDLVSWVIGALNLQMSDLKDEGDFVNAHSVYCKLQDFRASTTENDSTNDLSTILHEIKDDNQQSLEAAESVSDSCETLIRSMRQCFESHSQGLTCYQDTMGRLRDKMWYVADIRTSAIYDEVRSVANALREMGKLTKPARNRLSPSFRHWTGSRTANTSSHLKTEAQVLELLSAPFSHGGRNKLSDDQSRALALWMERNAIENLCRGEERLHKLCMEIRRAVDQATSETSALMSSTLFARDKSQQQVKSAGKSTQQFWGQHGNIGRFDMLTLRTDVAPSIDASSSASSHALSTRSSRDYLDSWSPSVTNRSSVPFWSPVMTEARPPSSATSIGSSQTQGAPLSPAKRQVNNSKLDQPDTIENVRQRTISLLLSDLASTLFSHGSETDCAFWTGLGGELTEKHLLSLYSEIRPTDETPDFDYEAIFAQLVRQLSASCNPYVKLQHLLEIDTLLAPYTAKQESRAENSQPEVQSRVFARHNVKGLVNARGADIKVEGFRKLFCNRATRPAAIFRDFQCIAALVPSRILETTPQGKAFWNAAAAISGLKQEACSILVETADSIIAHHSNNRGHGKSSSTAQKERDSATFSVPNRTPSPEEIGPRTMSDAAYLLQITAKEGDIVAQRELGTLYLTNPELMDHIIAPLSRPRDVFKEEIESKWRRNQDPTRCDPTTMCVAHHWMSLSSKGGDSLATEYLRQREEMDRLP